MPHSISETTDVFSIEVLLGAAITRLVLLCNRKKNVSNLRRISVLFSPVGLIFSFESRCEGRYTVRLGTYRTDMGNSHKPVLYRSNILLVDQSECCIERSFWDSYKSIFP